MPKRLLVLAVLLLIPVPARADRAAYRYPIGGRPELRLSVADGSVQIRPGARDRIEIEVETVGWKIGPGGLTIRQSQSGDRVQFELRQPWRFMVVGRNRITIKALVPPALDLDVSTGDGAVDLEDLEGNVRIHTGDGAVHAWGLRGDLGLESGDGNIRAGDLQGRLTGHTGDGRIQVAGRFESLRLRTGDGPVQVEVERGSKVAEDWSLSTGDGPLVVRLPEDLDAELEARTGEGLVSIDVPITIRGALTSRSLRGRMNRGGGRILLRSGDGPIRIESRAVAAR